MWKTTLEVGTFLGGSACTGMSLTGRTGAAMGFALVMTLASALPTVWHWADAFFGGAPQPD